MPEVRSITRELFMERVLPVIATTTRLFTSPANGYATSSKIRVNNQGSAATFSIWIGKNTDTENTTTAAVTNAVLGAAGAASSYVEFPGGDTFVNGGWVSVSSNTGLVSFQIHGSKVTIE